MTPETHLMIIQIMVKLVLMAVIAISVLGLFLVNVVADAILRRLPLTTYSQTSIQFALVVGSLLAVYWLVNNIGDVLRFVLELAQGAQV